MGDISFEEAKKAMIAKRFGGNASGASTGGGGSVRRKKKGALKSGGGRSAVLRWWNQPFTISIIFRWQEIKQCFKEDVNDKY